MKAPGSKLLNDAIHRAYYVVNLFRLKVLRWRGAKIHQSAVAYGHFTTYFPWNLEIGARTAVNQGAILECRDKVTIGTDVHISAAVRLHAGKLTTETLPRRHIGGPITIGNNVWLASGVVVGAGVTIGDNSIIGANSVVVRDVEANSLYAGNPAKKIRQLHPKDEPTE